MHILKFRSCRYTYKSRVFPERGKVDLPDVEFKEPSTFVDIERDTHWDAIAIDVLCLYKATAQGPAFVACKFKTAHSAIGHVAYSGMLQLAKQPLAVPRLSK